MYQISKFSLRGLSNKIDELTITCLNDAPHIICLSEHHLTKENIQTLLGAYYC
jgi:hypothetical protein